MDKIQKAQQSAQDNGNIYYVELPANNSFGFRPFGNEEYFIHLDDYGPNEMLSGKDILVRYYWRNTQRMEIMTRMVETLR